MKKLFTLFACLSFLTVHVASGQTFTTQFAASGDTAAETGNGVLHIDNKIRATNNTVVVKWRVVDTSVNLGADGTPWVLAGICDNVLCYLGAPLLAGTTYTTDAYTTSFGTFYALMDGTNAPENSTAWVRVNVRDTFASGTNKTLTFIANKQSTGIRQAVLEEGLQLFPNPASGSVFVSVPEGISSGNISIVAADGRQVILQAVTDKVNEVKLANLTSGIYFAQLRDASGSVVATRRFILN